MSLALEGLDVESEAYIFCANEGREEKKKEEARSGVEARAWGFIGASGFLDHS